MPSTIIIAGILILVGAFSYSAMTTLGRNETVVELDPTKTSVREVQPMMDGMVMPMAYADGKYETSVKYEVPNGYVESMDVLITIEDSLVIDAAVVSEIVNPVSNSYVDSFEQYYKDEVIGQPVDNISLSRVGGASLTNAAFDAALQNIKNEAAGGMMNPIAKKDGVSPIPLPGIVTDQGIVIRPRPDAPTESDQESRGLKVILVDKDPENTSDSQYQNGTYMVELAYYAWPTLYEPMRTQITLKDGIIVDAQQLYATIDYSHSVQYQQQFDSLYKEVVIGMPLANTPIARIGQASETTDGFNDALEAIKTAAQKS
ncbi:hypothetical protein K2Q16_02200 [Patescibacteria group bacterium]|nr:hypothetical protein [Patescibacteria group bacterium]